MDETRKEDIAVLFADITRSTELYQNVGDEKAYEIIVQSIEMLIEHTQNLGGTVVKTIGDEIMAYFPNVDLAVQAAMGMQQAMINSPNGIKVGFHAGPVIFSDDDIFGDAVNIASRMVGKAESGQIVTLEQDVQLLSKKMRPFARKVRTDWINGVEDTVTFFEFVWWDEDEDSMTRVASSTDTFNNAETPEKNALLITFQNQKIEVGADLKSLTMGRKESNDLVVVEKFVSKEHAKISFSQNKYTLKDNSANGTFILPDDGSLMRMRKWDLVELTGAGTIGLGKAHDPNSEWSIRYEVQSE